MGKPSINGPFSMAMLNNQMVGTKKQTMKNHLPTTTSEERISNLGGSMKDEKGMLP